MRIVQVINSFGHGSGGAERLVQDLHVDLLAAGIDAHLVALEACDTSGLKHATSLGFSKSYRLGSVLELRKYLTRLSPKPDVIHAHLFPTSAYVSGLKRMDFISCPVVFTEHNTSNRRREKAILKPLDGAIYSAFEKIYCISAGTKASLVKAYPQLTNKAEIIENGATLRFEHFSPRQLNSRVKILSVGRLSKQKNYAAALYAISMLEVDVVYTILGEGDDRAELEELASSLGISDKVSFVGHKPDITSFLQDADIFLIPSLWEGFGLAAVEGMNAGLPLVASNVPGLREVVGIDDGCGLFMSPLEPKAIAIALETLIGDPQKRQEMGKAAFERAKLFDRQTMAAAYISAYRSMVPEVAYA